MDFSSVDEDPISCGLCGVVLYTPAPFGKPVLNPNIRKAYGSAAHVQVSLTAGENDTDINAGETYSYDICPQCFEEKLKPWLEGQGALMNVKQWTS